MTWHQTRRDFLRTVTAGAAGALLPGRSLARLAAQSRRRVTIGGRPVKVIDVHAHCVIPVADIVKGTPLAEMGGGAGANILGPQRLQVMDEQGVDVQALTINGFWWYAADRDLARPDRPGAERGARQVGGGAPRSLRRDGVGGAAASRSGGRAARGRREAAGAARRLDRRARQRRGSVAAEVRPVLGQGGGARRAGRSCIPAARRTSSRTARLRGRGDLGNIIGNPLETTYFLSRLIFDGTLDKFPGLRVCARACRRLPAVLSRTHRSGVRRCGATPTAPTRRSRAST